MEARFPKKCFISYSYKDEDARQLLDKKLRARGVESSSFPPIKVSPNKFHSNPLIEAILTHPEHVYVKGGYSNLSFWVAFQRDYALRAHKQVQSFDPETMKIDKCRMNPLKLPIFPTYLSRDTKQLQPLFTYMQNRHISLHTWLNTNGVTEDNLMQTVNTVITNGGYCILFLTSSMVKSKALRGELEKLLPSHIDRILVAIVDKIPMKDIPGLSERNYVVQLYGENKYPDTQQWDDLIVNIYWLIYHPSYELH